MTDPFLILVTIATVVDAILAGAVLDYVIKQLPARRLIGIIAYRKFFVASDLSNGRFWYIPLGLLAYLLTFAAAILGYSRGIPTMEAIPFYVAAGCALAHAFGTSQAVPASLRVLKFVDNGDEATLNRLFDEFARWVVVRGIFGAPMFVAMLVGLIMLA